MDDQQSKTAAEWVEVLSNGNVTASPDYISGEGVITCRVCGSSVRITTEESAKEALKFSEQHKH
jgi:hypothetical protein